MKLHALLIDLKMSPADHRRGLLSLLERTTALRVSDTRDCEKRYLTSREEVDQKVAAIRRRQVGSGRRGDKIGLVVDHRSGRKAPLRMVREGRLDIF